MLKPRWIKYQASGEHAWSHPAWPQRPQHETSHMLARSRTSSGHGFGTCTRGASVPTVSKACHRAQSSCARFHLRPQPLTPILLRIGTHRQDPHKQGTLLGDQMRPPSSSKGRRHNPALNTDARHASMKRISCCPCAHTCMSSFLFMPTATRSRKQQQLDLASHETSRANRCPYAYNVVSNRAADDAYACVARARKQAT